MAARIEGEVKSFQREALGGLPFPTGQTWEWEGSEVTIKFGKRGIISTSDGSWESRGLVTSWSNIGDNHVLLKIEKGRADDLIALLVFNEALTEYMGWGFGGRTMALRKRVN